jgi:large subunit ribosomal protein L6
MSRIGREPITIPAGVEVKIDENNHVTVKGPKGTIERTLVPQMIIEQKDGVITVSRPDDEKTSRSLHGLTRTLVNDMVVGVTDGFSKTLEVNGVGYRAAKEGNKLVLNIGYSHTVEIPEIDGITIDVPNANTVVINGSTSSRSASSPPTSAPSVRLSRTRARASSTPASTSAARSARPARNKGRCA